MRRLPHGSPTRVLRRVVASAALWLVLAPGAAPADATPSVARPHFRLGREARAVGTSFFVPTRDEIGVAAVATAHAFDLAELARAKEVEFRLGASGARVAVASRLLAPAGRAYHAPGSSLREDYVLFALDAAPRGVRVLALDPRPAPEKGERVRILGVPSQVKQDEDDLFGEVFRVADDRIEVDLDAPADLRGWGGAPVLRHPSGEVIGMLQAAQPVSGTLRLSVSPIDALRGALDAPAEGGRGLPLARAAEGSAGAGGAARARSGRPAPATARVPEPAAEDEPENATGAPDPPPPPAPARGRRGRGRGADPEQVAAAQRPEGAPLMSKQSGDRTDLRLDLERPTDRAVVGDSQGAFLSGRAVALRGDMKKFDVVLVLDTSGSTAEASGSDIDGNGVTGKPAMGGVGALFGLGSTDPGDSILCAEVAAGMRLLAGFDPRNTRVSLVTFAGDPPDAGGGGFFGRGVPNAAITEEPLTTDFKRIARALDRVRARGPEGATHMAAGLDQATVELLGLEGGMSKPDRTSEKIVLFLTDGQPTLPYGPGADADNVRAVLRAADRAHKAGIRVHTFAIGPEALAGPVATVEMASRTDGYFTPVRNPGDIVDVVENVSFANIESIEIRNLSTGAKADVVETNPDGGFGALVPLQAGLNRLEVVARASDGSEAKRTVQVTYVPGTAEPTLPVELVAQRNRLLEQKLIELRRARLESEREQVEKTRRELALEVERERQKAQEAADRQRKELNLEVERDGDAATPR
jgi:Mg-chelatase subunit ChlD